LHVLPLFYQLMDFKPIAEVVYKGELRTQAVHLLSGQKIITDAPLDNQGKGQAFSPTDLVAAAWLSCMFTIMGIVMQKHDFQANIQGKVMKVMYTDPRRIGELHAKITIKGNLNEKQKQMLEHAARNCPVAKSLSVDIQQVIDFEYVG